MLAAKNSTYLVMKPSVKFQFPEKGLSTSLTGVSGHSTAASGRFENDELIQDSRQLFYPKIKFSIMLETERQFIGYITAKTKISSSKYEHHEFTLGSTESRKKDFGENSTILFHRRFEVPFQTGVDDLQTIILEIYDGDQFQTSEGYLLSTVQFPVIQLARPEIRTAIVRGFDVLGYIIIESSFDVDCQQAVLDDDHDAMAQSGKAFSTVPGLNNAEYFDAAVMGFFHYKPPTLQEIIDSNPFISNVRSSRIEFGLNAEKICPFSKQMMKKNDSSVYIKLCTYQKKSEAEQTSNDETKEDESNTTEIPPWSERLHVIWTSLQIYRHPYEILVDSIALKTEDLMGKNKMLVFQVYVTNWDDLVATVPPRIACYCEISKDAFIAAAGKKELIGADEQAANELSPGGLLKLQFKRPPAKKDDKFSMLIQAQTRRGWRSLFSKKSKNDEEKVKDDCQRKEESLFPTPVAAEQSFDEPDTDAKPVAVDNEPCGTLTLSNIFVIGTIGDIGPGDSRYENIIQRLYKKTRSSWIKDMKILFNEHSTRQSDRIFMMSSVLNRLLQGTKILPYVVADISFPCTQNLISQVASTGTTNSDGTYESLFGKSSVLQVLEVVYLSIGLLSHNCEMKVYAGGAVCTPPDEYMYEAHSDGKASSKKTKHWAFGLSRNCAFPLCEELVAAELRNGSNSRIRPNAERMRLLRRHEGSSNWGGKDYCWNSSVSSTTDLLQAAMEAAVIYHPLINKEALESGHGNESGHIPHQDDLNKERYIAAVGTDHVTCGAEFWVKVPNSLESVSTKYNYDIDAIQALLEKPIGPQETGIVVWVLGHSPSHSCLSRLDKLLKHLLSGSDHTGTRENPNEYPCLLIVLAAEVQQIYDETSSEALKAIANPFEAFYQHWYYALKDNEYVMEYFKNCGIKEKGTDGPTSSKYRSLFMPRLAVYHHCTWPEVVAAAYLKEISKITRTVTTFTQQNPTDDDEDIESKPESNGAKSSGKSNNGAEEGSSKQGFNGPMLEMIFDVLKHKFARSDDLRYQYFNLPQFRQLVDGDNAAKTQDLRFMDDDQEDMSSQRQDLSKIRLNMAGNAEMKRRFEIENDKLLRSALIKFVAESLELRENFKHAAVVENATKKGPLLASRKEKDCSVYSCSIS